MQWRQSQSDWATASEINNNFFTIFKSSDAVIWTELSKISGAGNSNQVKNYSTTDYDYHGNVAYYRLNQTDYDGTTTWFKISAVNCFTVGDLSVTIYPNPFSTFAAIMINDASQINNCELRIFNDLGEEVINTVITQQLTTLETSNLPSGIYLYKVINNGKIIQSGKLISKQSYHPK